MSEPLRPSGWRGVPTDAVLLLFVAGLGLKAVYGPAHCRDLDLMDECPSWAAPVPIPTEGPPPVEYSPLYALWNLALVRFGVPLAEVPCFSWACLAVLLPSAVYLLASSLGAGRAAAVAAGGFLPATTLIDIWPYPIHLTAT